MTKKITPRALTLDRAIEAMSSDGCERFKTAFGGVTMVDEDQWPIKAGAALRSTDFADLACELLTSEELDIFEVVTAEEYFPLFFIDRHCFGGACDTIGCADR